MEINKEKEYEVEKILNRRDVRKKTEAFGYVKIIYNRRRYLRRAREFRKYKEISRKI